MAHANRVRRKLERDVFPWIGSEPIAELKAPELLAVVRRIEERGTLKMAHDTLQICGRVWRYAVAKTNTPHIVPLSRQAVEILRELYPLTGQGRYVFPNARYPRRERPMSANTLWGALLALDVRPDRMTMHGFRAMARTILDEVLGFRPDFIEHQLAHAVRDTNGRAYNRTAFRRS